jgi:hypothetical protein
VSVVLSIRYVMTKALPVYTCSKCPAKATGSTVRFEGTSLEDAQNQTVSNSHMPIGWASYGDEHRCPEHK